MEIIEFAALFEVNPTFGSRNKAFYILDWPINWRVEYATTPSLMKQGGDGVTSQKLGVWSELGKLLSYKINKNTK